jgi:two-component system chemotaxis sensor kinase CheA
VDDLTKEFLAESNDGLERMGLCLTELEKRPDDGELVAEIFRAVHTIKGTTGFLGFRRLGMLAHTGEGLLAALRSGKIAVTSELISGLLALVDGIGTILHLIESTGIEGDRCTDDDTRLIELLTRLKVGNGELTATGMATSQDGGLENHVGRGDRPDPADIAGTATSSQSRTLRIDVEVLNRMMNLVGELVLTRNQILQCSQGADNFPELARRLSNVTSDLRESVMQVRMQPVGHLFRKFPKMVRDLGESCGRKVRVEFEGQDTGLDKSLLEAVRDPLTHAVRNAVDHGIEAPEERLKAGKAAEGLVRLRAFQQSGSVVIEVIDDGAGIATERVLATAIERGVVTAEHAASMTQREVLQMIFVPGFSTAKEITSVSGRGVGMDVVRANVQRVGGSVEVESRVGRGTTLRMRVPLTLAIVPALVVESGGQSFALPQASLTELVYVPGRDAESALERVGAVELYRLREGLLPLVWLDRLLALEQSQSAKKRGFYIAAIEAGGRRFGLVVDDLKAPEEIVVKPLSTVLREIGIFSGATLLGNGALALILDAAAIGARAGVRPVPEAAMIGGGLELPAQASETQIEVEDSMVIYETKSRGPAATNHSEQMALPLSAVERIERVPISEVEYVDGHAVLQYGGELLPLEDENGVLVEMEAAQVAMATVLICLRNEGRSAKRVGLVVRRVLDVSAGTPLPLEAVWREAELLMVKGRVTSVNREFGPRLGEAAATLQEVA